MKEQKVGIFKKRYFHEELSQSTSMKSSTEMGCINHSAKCKNLQREHQMLVRLNHPNIVKCDIQFYQNVERCCIRLEQADCDFLEYLSHFFMNRNRAFFRTQVSLLRNISEAIDYLHSLDYVHNDIKLENCLLFVENKSSASIHQSQKQKSQIFQQSSKNHNMIQMTSSSLSQISSKSVTEVTSATVASSSSDTTQTNDRKNSSASNSKSNDKSNQKGKLVLKLADFEFSCSANQCTTVEYFKTWKMRNRKYMSPELLELCNLLDMKSQSKEREQSQVLLSSTLLQNQFKRVCSLQCDEPISVLSTNGEEEGSDSQLTISTDLTVGSGSTHNCEKQTLLVQSQEILHNHIKTINIKANDIFCYGILVFSAIFGVYPFEKQPTKCDSIYSFVCEERWNEFWLLFNHRIQIMLSQGFLPEQIEVLKDLLEKLLSANPALRPDSKAILKHPFFQATPSKQK